MTVLHPPPKWDPPSCAVPPQEYCDGPPAKLGGAAVGALAALATILTRGRVLLK